MIPANISNIYGPDDKVDKVIIAENQTDDYIPLPALYFNVSGAILTEWTLSPEEIRALVDGGRIRMCTFTFGHKFQPVKLEVVDTEHMLPLETVS